MVIFLAVEITYDEDKIGFEELVDTFFRNIDPTDPEEDSSMIEEIVIKLLFFTMMKIKGKLLKNI